MENLSREICYARVSSKGQNLDRQLAAFEKLGYKKDQIIVDKQSGRNFDRPGYEALKGVLGLRAGDTLVITELDRLGRKKSGIKEELKYWKKRGVRVKILNIPTSLQDFGDQEWIQDMVNNVMIEVIASMAEQEWEISHQRQREGIDAMPMKEGKRVSRITGNAIGRPAIAYPKNWDELYEQYQAGQISSRVFSERAGVSRTTLFRMKKAYENEKKERC